MQRTLEPTRVRVVAAVAVVSALVTACGGTDSTTPESSTSTSVVDGTVASGSTEATAEAEADPAAQAWEYLEAFQRIADDNGGNRALGTPGAAASADYIADQLAAAGLEVTRQEFTAADGSSATNVLAELPGSRDNSVAMVGAHFDSVPAGPGINDNASGVAAVMASAVHLARSGEAPEQTMW